MICRETPTGRMSHLTVAEGIVEAAGGAGGITPLLERRRQVLAGSMAEGAGHGVARVGGGMGIGPAPPRFGSMGSGNTMTGVTRLLG